MLVLKTYIKVENNVVTNRAVFDGDMPPDWPEFAAYQHNEEAQIGWIKHGGNFVAPPPVDAPTIPPAILPELFASAGIIIVTGVVTTLELAPQIASTYYEDGWMQVFFSEAPGFPYLVFVQTDVPMKIEQFKDLGSFELIFSDPATGDPIEPGRIDLQILKVR